MEPSEEMFVARALERIAIALEENNLHVAEAMQIELQETSQQMVRQDLDLRRDLAAKAEEEKNQFLKMFLPPHLAAPGASPAPGATLVQAGGESQRPRRVPRHTTAGGPGQ